MSKKGSDDKEGNGRLKILEAAEKLFAEKGFDGSRVDEIATIAGVNKALIYYYFDSKEKILEELLKNYIDKTMQKKHEFIKEANFFDFNQLQEYIGKNLDYVKESGGEIFKIATVEALKNNKVDDSLFRMMDLFLKDLEPLLSEMGITINREKTLEMLVGAFFFGMAPVVFYLTLGEKWAEYYNIDMSELHNQFLSTLNEVYVKQIFNSLYISKK
jgi:AcrR family transcriptional regulator